MEIHDPQSGGGVPLPHKARPPDRKFSILEQWQALTSTVLIIIGVAPPGLGGGTGLSPREARLGTSGTNTSSVHPCSLGFPLYFFSWVFGVLLPLPNLLVRHVLLNSLTQRLKSPIRLEQSRWWMLGHHLAGRRGTTGPSLKDVTWWPCLLLPRFVTLPSKSLFRGHLNGPLTAL